MVPYTKNISILQGTKELRVVLFLIAFYVGRCYSSPESFGKHSFLVVIFGYFFGDFVDDFLILWTQWAYTVKLLAKALLIMSEHVHNCGENNVAAAI